MARCVPSEERAEVFHKAGGTVWENPVSAAAELSGQTTREVPAGTHQIHGDHPRSKCVHELFEEQAARTPDAVAVVFENEQLTYGELNQRANQLAHHLRLRGIGLGITAAICLDPSLELLVAILGVLKAGGTYLPLDPGYPAERITYMLEKSGARLVILAGTPAAGFVAPATIEVVRLDEERPVIAGQFSRNLAPLANPDDLIYIIFTSGSTGQPKGAAIRHGGFANLLNWYVTDFGICGTDRVLVCSSISFDLTQKNFYAPLLKGGTLYFSPPGPYDASLLAGSIQKHGITLINCTPSALHPLVESAGERSFESLASLRTVVLGGEPISIPRIRPWLTSPTCNAEIINTYGPTECTDICAFHRLTRENLDHYNFAPLGRPIPHVQLVILDEALQRCRPGSPGELCIGGAGVGAGYLNDPEMTAAKFPPNPFSFVAGTRLYRTGDRVRMLPDGNLEFMGRMDNQVKIRGFRVELGEIEAVLNAHPNIKNAVVIAREDKPDEKFLAAYLVPRTQPPPAVSELRGFLKAKLPHYMVPAVFVNLAALPLNRNGKVDRNALPAPAGEISGWEAGYVAPRSPTEERLAEIWSGVFGLKQVGINDNFFELGGHSLLAIRLVNEIKKSLHQNLPLPVFFRDPTIEGIARSLQQEGQAGAEMNLIPLQEGKSSETIYFLDAGIGLCRLAQLVDLGPSSFATIVPLPPTALESAILNRTADLPNLETLAAAHAAVIRKHASTGPCILAGHSFGGLVAFEVAHQLQREGRKVDMILLVDSWAVFPSAWRRLGTLSLERAQKSLKFRAGHMWWRMKRKISATMPGEPPAPGTAPALAEPAAEPGQPLSQVPTEVPWEILGKIYRNAMAKYRLRPLDTRAILFRAEDSDQAHLYRIDDSLGWEGFFKGGFEIVENSGDHFTLLLPPHVNTIARRIKEVVSSLNR
jgi:amino acid adenylation domain-containing protein